jgi:hypothetical protein
MPTIVLWSAPCALGAIPLASGCGAGTAGTAGTAEGVASGGAMPIIVPRKRFCGCGGE